jgi:hypothetical protein
MPYLLAVIREALRLFAPAAQGSFRLTVKEVGSTGHLLE